LTNLSGGPSAHRGTPDCEIVGLMFLSSNTGFYISVFRIDPELHPSHLANDSMGGMVEKVDNKDRPCYPEEYGRETVVS